MSSRIPHALAVKITIASDASFMHGLHVAMIVAGGLAIAGALVGLLVQRGTTEAGPGYAAT